MYANDFFVPYGDIHLVQYLHRVQGPITAIARLRDVYSTVKIQKILPMLNRDASMLQQTAQEVSQILYQGRLGPSVSFDELHDAISFQDVEIQDSVLNTSQTALNITQRHQEMHNLVNKIESQNLELVQLLSKVGDTAKDIRTSDKYA